VHVFHRLRFRSVDAVVGNHETALHDCVACVVPFVLIVAHEERPVRVQVQSVDVEPHLFLFLKKIFDVGHNLGDSWGAVVRTEKRILVGFVPVPEQLFDLDFVHAEGIRISDGVFFKYFEEVDGRKVSELDMDAVVCFSPHVGPQTNLLAQSLLRLFITQLLKQLVPSEKMAGDVRYFFVSELVVCF